MLDAHVFELCGFLVDRAFLTHEDCARIRGEMTGAAAEHAGVVHDGEVVLDLGHRSTKRVGVGDATARFVADRLDEARPRIERHFRVELQGCQEPQFLRYSAGDFFRLHADSNDAHGAPGFLRDRKISTVVFLGHDDAMSRDGRGGELLFHDLFDDPRLSGRGFPFPAAEGTFLAFPSTALHEVTTVTAGQRFSIATWFY
jgi:predicted 2-oxoglutarate/Fe(II)-dependent dioxygenase YbiX